MVIEPEDAPAAFGENVTVMLQCAAASKLVPQLLLAAKGGVATMPEILSAAVPVLVRVTTAEPLV